MKSNNIDIRYSAEQFRKVLIKYKDTEEFVPRTEEMVRELVNRCNFFNMKEKIIDVLSDVAYLPCSGYCDSRSIDNDQLLSYAEKIIEITQKFGKENEDGP